MNHKERLSKLTKAAKMTLGVVTDMMQENAYDYCPATRYCTYVIAEQLAEFERERKNK